jgi:hypothetical protein
MSVSSLKDLCVYNLLLDPPALRERLRPEDPVLPQDLKGEIQPVLDGFISSMRNVKTFLNYCEAYPEFHRIFLRRYAREMRDLEHLPVWPYGSMSFVELAIVNDNRELFTFLIEKIGVSGDGGLKLLHAVIHVASQNSKSRQRCSEIVREVLSHGVDVNALGLDGITPLHHAALFGLEEIVEVLIVGGADVNALNWVGMTPLHQAGSEEVVAVLLSRGADVNAVDRDGRTPLHLYATGLFGKRTVCLLLANGADDRVVDRNGRTALDYARRYGHNMDNIRELSRLSRNRTIRKTCTMGLWLLSEISIGLAAWILPKMIGK